MMRRFAPATAGEVKDIVAAAVADRTRLEILGGGTQRSLHSPVEADATLSTSALSGVLDYDPEELVVSARAGTPLAEIEALLAERQQMLAFEPFDHRLWFGLEPGAATLGTTLGGIVAANVSGPRRLSSGAARDHVLGFAAVSGRGEELKGGGAVVKNVSGFDLPKLLTGSWGTLAVLTSVTLRVVPRPRTELTLLFRGLADDAAVRLMCSALGTPAGVAAAAHVPAMTHAAGNAPAAAHALAVDGGATTALRLEGFGPSVEARRLGLLKRFGALAPVESLEGEPSAGFWRRIAALETLPREGRVWWRVCVPASRGHEVRSRLAAEPRLAAQEVAYLYDWGGGLVWVALPEHASRPAGLELDALARSLGGHARLVRAPAPLWTQLASTGQGRGATAGARALDALQRRVKAAFDPAGVLNPGLALGPESESGAGSERGAESALGADV